MCPKPGIFLFMLLHPLSTQSSTHGSVLGTTSTKLWWITQWLETQSGWSDTLLGHGDNHWGVFPTGLLSWDSWPSNSCVVKTQSPYFDTTRHQAANLVIFISYVISPLGPQFTTLSRYCCWVSTIPQHCLSHHLLSYFFFWLLQPSICPKCNLRERRSIWAHSLMIYHDGKDMMAEVGWDCGSRSLRPPAHISVDQKAELWHEVRLDCNPQHLSPVTHFLQSGSIS